MFIHTYVYVYKRKSKSLEEKKTLYIGYLYQSTVFLFYFFRMINCNTTKFKIINS